MQYVQRNGPGEAQEVSRSDVDFAIDEWIIGRNAERNRAILKRRLFDWITYERLAEEFDMSVRQIKTIVYKNEDILFRHIRG